MKKTPNPNSMLGLALLGASAFIATFYSAKATSVQANSADNGRALQFSGGNDTIQAILSCVAASSPFDCHITANSGTTALEVKHTFVADGLGNFYQTAGNTSASIMGNDVDTTSQVIRITRKSEE